MALGKGRGVALLWQDFMYLIQDSRGGGLLRGQTEFLQDNEMKEWVGIDQD